ncbi:CLUMA_CG006170, isoform A, partial [Clunio marinus]
TKEKSIKFISLRRNANVIFIIVLEVWNLLWVRCVNKKLQFP